MTKEPAVINESVNPKDLPKASESRKKALTEKFVSLGHPEHEAERAFFQVDDRVSEDDLDALNFMLNMNGYASVMPEDADAVLKEAKKARKAEKADKDDDTDDDEVTTTASDDNPAATTDVEVKPGSKVKAK